MRRTIFTALAFLSLASVASAQTPTPAAAAAHAAYTTADTDIGTLLDDPAARAIVDKHLPNFSSATRSTWHVA